MTCRHFSIFVLTVATALLTAHAADTVYFPKGAEHWYPMHLEAMKEPSLYERQSDRSAERYRFLWLRTFHRPLAFRIQKDSAGITLRVVRLSGAGGNEPGHIEHDETLTLTTNQWDRFLKLVDTSSFWQMPTAEKHEGEKLDGSQWILEGQVAGKYHVVDRWTPAADAAKRHLDGFVACCRYLLALSKQEIPKNDDY
jgi:hypothetical protein